VEANFQSPYKDRIQRTEGKWLSWKYSNGRAGRGKFKELLAYMDTSGIGVLVLQDTRCAQNPPRYYMGSNSNRDLAHKLSCSMSKAWRLGYIYIKGVRKAVRGGGRMFLTDNRLGIYANDLLPISHRTRRAQLDHHQPPWSRVCTQGHRDLSVPKQWPGWNGSGKSTLGLSKLPTTGESAALTISD